LYNYFYGDIASLMAISYSSCYGLTGEMKMMLLG